MLHESRLRAAIDNNVAWCGAMARAHGVATNTDRDAWWAEGTMPDYYPNAISLTRGVEPAVVSERAREIDALSRFDWGVKDSFAEIDLSDAGFHRLFDGTWLDALPAEGDVAADAELSALPLTWRRIEDDRSLQQWERAWGGSHAARSRRIFPASLLTDARVHVLSASLARDRHEIRGGAVLFVANEAVGITNVFAKALAESEVFTSLCTHTRGQHPATPQVLYTSDDASLAAASRNGFSLLGPLSVWVRAPVGLRD